MGHRDKTVQREPADVSEHPADKFDVDRLAQLIADGEASFPTDLALPQREKLLHCVARLRRARLLNFIARAIADDIFRSRPNQGAQQHA